MFGSNQEMLNVARNADSNTLSKMIEELLEEAEVNKGLNSSF